MTLHIRYLGWTAFEMTTQQGTRLVLDPMLSGRPDDGIPPSPVPVDTFYTADYVLITHAAADHVGQAFEIMQNSKAILVCDAATGHMAIEAGIPADRIYRMVSGVRFEFKDFAVKALPAQHLSLGKLKQGFVSAQPLSYLIETTAGERIFFGGDTSIHGDLKLFGELYRPQLAILGVGGVNVHGQSLTELYPDEAVLAAKWLGVRFAIPIHYRLDEGEKFVEELKNKAPEIKGVLLTAGDRYPFDPGS